MQVQGPPDTSVNAPISRQAGPLTSGMGFAPPLGTSGGARRWPSERPNYRFAGSGGPRSSSDRSGEIFRYTPNVGPMRNVDFGPNPMVKDTMGFQSNYWINRQILIKSFRRKYQDADLLMQLVITKKEKGASVGKKHSRKNLARRYTTFSVPMWNLNQQLSELKPETPEDVKTPEQVWSNWYIHGVVRSQEGYEERYGFYDEGKEKLLNITIRGQVFAFNLWGNNISAETNLWLILKKAAVARKVAHYEINPFGQDYDNPDGVGTELTDRPYQLFPYANASFNYPPESELEFYDEFGFKRRGLAIYVGKSERNVDTCNTKTLPDVPYSVSAIATQKQMFILVDPMSTVE